MRTLALPLGLHSVLLLALTAAPIRATDEGDATIQSFAGPRFDHVEKLTGRVEAEIRFDRGHLKVRGASALEAHAEGRLGKNVTALEIQHQGNWLRFDLKKESAAPGEPQELESELVLVLPAGSDLLIEGPAVDIDIEGITGKIDVRTLSGTVAIKGKPAELQVQTITGKVSTLGLECPLAVLRSVAGAIEIDGQFEELTARTADAPILVRAAISDEARLESGQGRVRFEGELGELARLVVLTQGGEASLLLPRDLAGNFAARSFSGELDNGLGPGFVRAGLRRKSSWTTGQALRRIEVETFDGKISLLPR